jgi:hypothetical protein
MRVRWIGLALTLVLAVAAGWGGHRLGTERRPTPTTFAGEPVPAVSPRYPVTPAEVVPDDPYPALEPGTGLRPLRLGTAPFQVRVPVPRGWVRSDSTAGEWRWYPAADKTVNIYFLRVRQVGANYDTVPAALDDRIAALRNADEVDDLVIEQRQEDRFVCHYVAGAHTRVSYEGYLPRGDVAYLYVAVIGRMADRDGLRDLFDRVMAGARTDLS